jgi:DNA-binding PadR family transcriptional regulator
MDGTYTEAFNSVVEGVGMEGRDPAFAQVAYAHKPDPITPQDYVVRSPYSNPKNFKADMAASAERGWLEAVGEDQYIISDKGVEVVKQLLGALYEGTASIESLPEAELERIHDLLQKVVDKAHKLPEPSKKWSKKWGKRFQKAFVVEGAPTLVRVRRRIIDMFGFRDDGHLAAWKAVEEDGQIWDVFTNVWRDQANTAEKLAEQLSGRNYDEDSYAAALGELAQRGWVEQENGKYVATEKGSKLRQRAEDATDRYFDAPWLALGKDKMEETKSLMEKLAQAIEPPEEQESP